MMVYPAREIAPETVETAQYQALGTITKANLHSTVSTSVWLGLDRTFPAP